MEEQIEKEMGLLKTWMECKNIPKSEQITYYHKLIAYLESSKKELKTIAFKTGIGSFSLGIGSGLLIGGGDNLRMGIGGFFLLYGIVFGFIPPMKLKKPDFKQYEEIEEKRKLIKKWYIAKKE